MSLGIQTLENWERNRKAADLKAVQARMGKLTEQTYEMLKQVESLKAKDEASQTLIETLQASLAYHQRECTCDSFKHEY